MLKEARTDVNSFCCLSNNFRWIVVLFLVSVSWNPRTYTMRHIQSSSQVSSSCSRSSFVMFPRSHCIHWAFLGLLEMERRGEDGTTPPHLWSIVAWLPTPPPPSSTSLRCFHPLWRIHIHSTLVPPLVPVKEQMPWNNGGTISRLKALHFPIVWFHALQVFGPFHYPSHFSHVIIMGASAKMRRWWFTNIVCVFEQFSGKLLVCHPPCVRKVNIEKC